MFLINFIFGVNKMKVRNLTFFSIAVAVLCVAARTATLFYTTQGETGFFIGRLANLGIILSVAIIVAAAVATLFAFTAKERVSIPVSLSPLSKFAFVLLGAAITVYSLGFNSHSFAVAWQHGFEVISGILAGLWFILYGISPSVGIRLPKITAILPCIHFIMRLIVVFTSLSTAALVAEHVFSLAYHVSVMVYMLNLGRILGEAPAKNTARTFFPITVCTFIFTATSVLSRLIALIAKKQELIHGESALDITGIVLSVFLLLIAADICKESNKTKEEDENDLQC